MLNKIKKNKKGFTIIETMIVLAIAGLIMLIVFLAVPALQRSARNTQRKNDAGNIASGISTWISNNNGTVPGYETGSYTQATCNSDLASIVGGIKLSYYTSTNIQCAAGTTAPPACTTTGISGTCPVASTVNTEDVYMVPGNVCNGNSPSTTNSSTGATATTRSYVILYEVETGGAPTEQCIEG